MSPCVSRHGLGGASLSRRGLLRAAATGAGALALGGAAALAGCAPEEVAPRGLAELSLAFPLEGEPRGGFDPFFGWGCGFSRHAPLIQRALMTLDGDSLPILDAADSLDIADDGLTWTFTLPDDLVYSDGRPCTASDAAFTIERVRASDAARVSLGAIESVEAVDERTLAIALSEPDAFLGFELACIGIVPEEGYDENAYGSAPVGAGPFLLEEWERGSHAVLARNPRYTGRPPAAKRIRIAFASPNAACGGCYSGAYDAAFATVDLASQSIDGYSLFDAASSRCIGISLPLAPAGTVRTVEGAEALFGNDVTADADIRFALFTGVSRESVVSAAIGGYGEAAFTPADRTPWGSTADRIAVDQKAAIASLEAAGWRAGKDGIRRKGSLRASLDVYHVPPEGDAPPYAKRLLAAFSAEARKLGIEVLVREAAADQLREVARTNAIAMSKGSITPALLEALYASGSAQNVPGVANPEIDALLARAKGASTLDEALSELRRLPEIARAGRGYLDGWLWLGFLDHLYFKRGGLSFGDQGLHPLSVGWSLLERTWEWSYRESANQPLRSPTG